MGFGPKNTGNQLKNNKIKVQLSVFGPKFYQMLILITIRRWHVDFLCFCKDLVGFCLILAGLWLDCGVKKQCPLVIII